MRIFKNIISKITTTFSDFKEKPLFDRVQIPDEQGLFDKNSIFEEKKSKPKIPSQKSSKTRVGRDANKLMKRKLSLKELHYRNKSKSK